MSYYKMWVETIPVPKGRPRFYKGHAVTPARTREYESLLRQNWQHGVLSGEKLIVKMNFVMPIPKSLSKRKRESLAGTGHNKRPDLDNLVKAALDAANGVMIEDDSRIWKLIASKEYGECPSVQITIWNHDGGD